MSTTLRSYTRRYTFRPSIARAIVTVLEAEREQELLTTSELNRYETLDDCSYGEVLMTVLELQYRGLVALHPLGNRAGGPKGAPEYLVLGLTDRADGLLQSERYSIRPDGTLEPSEGPVRDRDP